MARKVFFSFHYENDVWRTNVVRNSGLLKANIAEAGFIDAVDFEQIKRGGDLAIRRWIDGQLSGTSVTVVLIGSQTNQRDYVKYELSQSFARSNGILGIYIHQIADRNGLTSSKGSNTFGEIGKDVLGNPIYFNSSYPTYDWTSDNGYLNLGRWVEEAARKAGRF